MELITGAWYPSSIDTIEKQTVFNLEALRGGLYSNLSSNHHPHQFVEAEAVYSTPIISKREVMTPEHGMRLIYSIAFQINPRAGIDAGGIWNHVLEMAPTLTFE